MSGTYVHTTSSTAGDTAATDVVELACLAPSVHNTQPWAWRVAGPTIELYADRRRRLVATDPLGHELVVSCGAALHHAQVAALGLGWQPAVERLPQGQDSDLLARIELSATDSTSQAQLALEALRRRRTDRRRLTSWPVPDERLRDLATVARAWEVVATAMTDPGDRLQIEALVRRAREVQAENPGMVEEQRRWTDHSTDDGIPATVLPVARQSIGQPSRFEAGILEDTGGDIESGDGLVVLGTVADDPSSWLRAGEALSALWLDATVSGLSVVPLSQIVEVPETRDAMQREVLVSLAVPHGLLRVGWPSVSRPLLPPTPRRPLAEVLTAQPLP